MPLSLVVRRERAVALRPPGPGGAAQHRRTPASRGHAGSLGAPESAGRQRLSPAHRTPGRGAVTTVFCFATATPGATPFAPCSAQLQRPAPTACRTSPAPTSRPQRRPAAAARPRCARRGPSRDGEEDQRGGAQQPLVQAGVRPTVQPGVQARHAGFFTSGEGAGILSAPRCLGWPPRAATTNRPPRRPSRTAPTCVPGPGAAAGRSRATPPRRRRPSAAVRSPRRG